MSTLYADVDLLYSEYSQRLISTFNAYECIEYSEWYLHGVQVLCEHYKVPRKHVLMKAYNEVMHLISRHKIDGDDDYYSQLQFRLELLT